MREDPWKTRPLPRASVAELPPPIGTFLQTTFHTTRFSALYSLSLSLSLSTEKECVYSGDIKLSTGSTEAC